MNKKLQKSISYVVLMAFMLITLAGGLVINGNGSVKAAGETMGNTGNGTTTDQPGANYISYFKYQASSSFTANVMNLKVSTGSSTGKIKLAIYSDNANKPGALLKSTEEKTGLGTGWQTLNLTSAQSLTSGTYYWLAIWSDSWDYSVSADSAAGAGGYITYSYASSWPSTMPTGGASFDLRYCMYAQNSSTATATATATNAPTATPAQTATPTAAAGAYIGNNGNGDTTDSAGAGYFDANCHTASSNMTVASMKIKLSTGSSTGKLKMAIYSDNSGNPGSLLRSTEEKTGLGTGWQTLNLTSSLSLTSGTKYWLAVMTDSWDYNVSANSSGNTLWYKNTGYVAWPSTAPTPAEGTSSYSYCIYASGSTGPTSTPGPTNTPTPTSTPTPTGTSTPVNTPTTVPAPTGSGLKDIVDSTKLGARPNPGSYSTPGSSQINCSVLDREFNAMQPTWYPNWGGWTGPYTYDFAGFNTWVNWGESYGKYQLVHCLSGWNMYMPDWFVNGTWSTAEMDNMFKEMIRSIIQSNSNNTKIEAWNVVNEMFDGQGTGGYRVDSESKLNQLGWETDQSGLTGTDLVNSSHPSYIGKAFQYAREYTNAKLELRDFGIEFDPDGAKFKAFYQLCAHLLNKGVPLDAVGLQCHMHWGSETYDYGKFNAVVQKLKGLGLEVYVTELDIGQLGDANAQKTRFQDFFTAARKAGVDQIYTWGVRDGGDPGWRASENALLFDADFNPKPAYYGAQQALLNTNNIVVRAKGSAGSEKIELRVDDVVKATWTLSKEFADYCYTGYSGSHNIKIAFVNDGNLRSADKNACVDYLKVNSVIHQSENQPTNTGNSAGYSEWMWWNGYIDFGSR